MVPRTGLEPARLTAHAPQTCVSTNSTTWANKWGRANKTDAPGLVQPLAGCHWPKGGFPHAGMTRAEIRDALLASYQSQGGINHLDGVNLPSQDSVNMLARDCMHLLFPGYFEASAIEKSVVPVHIDGLLGRIDQRLRTEVEKCLRFAEQANPAKRAAEVAGQALEQFPDLRRLIQTDVAAAFEGDPAARSVEEIILAYPCVLVISLQRVAHVLYHLQVPLLPRMLTEFGHERTGADIHPGARLGTHFFIDHCT